MTPGELPNSIREVGESKFVKQLIYAMWGVGKTIYVGSGGPRSLILRPPTDHVDSIIKHYAPGERPKECSACSTHYGIEVIISDEKADDRTDVVFYVKYVTAEQAYVNGRLEGGTHSARDSYEAAEADQREEQDTLVRTS